MSLRIMMILQKAYNRDNNGHLREEMNLLLVGLEIMKRV